MRAMVKGNATPHPVPRYFCRFSTLLKSVFALSLVFATSCSGSLFKVKPAAALSPMPSTVASVNLGSISFRAAPLLTDEESQELFEANLHLAGLLPVRVEINHNSGDAVEMKKVRFRLTDGAGVKWNAVSTKQAIARILKANGVSIYNPSSRKTFEHDFRSYELDLKSPLTHNEGRRQGLIMFLAPEKTPVSSPRGLVLTIEGLSQPATLKLN
jgi:hypothetical protein